MSEAGDIQFFSLCFARTFGIVTLLPFSKTLLSAAWRVVFTLLITFMTAPASVALEDWNIWQLPQQFLVGFIIALPVALFVSLAKMMGFLLDTGRGQTMGVLYDPVAGISDVYTAVLLRYYVWALLLFQGIMEKLILALKQSYQILPLADKASAAVIMSDFSPVLIRLLNFFIAQLWSLFLPFAILFLCVDFAFGLISRALPRMMFYAEAFQVKSYLMLLLLLILQRSYSLAEITGFASDSSLRALSGVLNG